MKIVGKDGKARPARYKKKTPPAGGGEPKPAPLSAPGVRGEGEQARQEQSVKQAGRAVGVSGSRRASSWVPSPSSRRSTISPKSRSRT